MSRAFRGFVLLFASSSLIGCGPSVEEQYKSAELKHKVASELLDELQQQVDEKSDYALRTLCKEATGSNYQLLNIEQDTLLELIRLEQGLGERSDPAELAKLAKRSETLNEQAKRVADFYERARTEGTPEHQQFMAKLNAFEPYQKLEQQKEAAATAKQELDELRAKIGS